MEFGCAFERIFSRFLTDFLDFFVGHNLLMLKNFWGILPLLNYF